MTLVMKIREAEKLAMKGSVDGMKSTGGKGMKNNGGKN
jgi:hypothetical protein